MKKNFVLLAFVVMILQSCIDLKEINTFATTSDATLKSLDDRNYTFTSSYLEYNLSKQFLSFSPAETERNMFRLPEVKLEDSVLKINQQADKTIALLAGSLQSYLQSIAKLSSKDLVNYDFSQVGTNIKNSPAVLSKLGISANDIDASLKVAKVATDGIMGRYREKNIRRIMIEYDSAFRNTATALNKSLGLLALNAEADIELLKTKYRVPVADPNLPVEMKLAWRKQYADELTTIQKKHVVIKRQQEAIQKLGAAHGNIAAKLAANNKLTSKQVIQSLKEHSGELKTLFSSIQQLLK